MKKIVALIGLSLISSISMHAQDAQKSGTTEKTIAQTTPEIAAENDAEAVAKFLEFNDEKKQDFKRLFLMKHKLFQDKNESIEKKKQFSEIVEAKIAASIDNLQLEKLKANTSLYKQLTEVTGI